MTTHLHRQLIRGSLVLYLISTWCSMAGMEIFGWLTFTLAVAYAFRKPAGEYIQALDLEPYLPWKTCLALLIITILGLAVNGTETADPVYDIGSQRWMFLLATHSFALALWPPSLRGYKFFLFFTTVVAIYAIFQSITGIDLMRPGSNRAVQPLDLQANINLWRSAGFFGSPLQYGYIFGQYVCLPLAMTLLLAQNKDTRSRLFWCSLVAYLIISLSIVTTFTRGAWLASGITHLVLAFFVSRRLAAYLAGIGGAVLTTLFITVEQFRLRVLTFFDFNYASNSDRVFLWKANIEMFKDYPILGIGYQENETRAGEYVARLGNPDAFTGHAHSNYLQMLAGTGITGFVTYMILISFMLWLTWRLWKALPKEMIWRRAIALGALGAQLQLHIGGFTECNFKAGATNHNLMVVWALVISTTALLKLARLEQLAPEAISSKRVDTRARAAI